MPPHSQTMVTLVPAQKASSTPNMHRSDTSAQLSPEDTELGLLSDKSNGNLSRAQLIKRELSAASSSYSDEVVPLEANQKDILVSDVPGLVLPEGIKVASDGVTLYNEASGYQAKIIEDRETGTYYLSNRGTEFNKSMGAVKDVVTDFLQAIGIETSQYDLAKQLGQNVFKALDGNVEFVGHSLGGGLAALQAVATGGKAVTFNAAGVSEDTLQRYGLEDANQSKIINYKVEGEALSFVQESTVLDIVTTKALTIPRNIGEVYDSIFNERMPNFGIPEIPEALGVQVTIPSIDSSGQGFTADSFSERLSLHGRDYINFSVSYMQRN